MRSTHSEFTTTRYTLLTRCYECVRWESLLSFLWIVVSPYWRWQDPCCPGHRRTVFPLTPTAVYQIVKDAFRRVADNLQEKDGVKAMRVRRLSTDRA